MNMLSVLLVDRSQQRVWKKSDAPSNMLSKLVDCEMSQAETSTSKLDAPWNMKAKIVDCETSHAETSDVKLEAP